MLWIPHQVRNDMLAISFPLFMRCSIIEIYDEKSDRQTLWKAFLKKGEHQHAPEKLSIVAKEIEAFLMKPLNAIQKKALEEIQKKKNKPKPF